MIDSTVGGYVNATIPGGRWAAGAFSTLRPAVRDAEIRPKPRRGALKHMAVLGARVKSMRSACSARSRASVGSSSAVAKRRKRTPPATRPQQSCEFRPSCLSDTMHKITQRPTGPEWRPWDGFDPSQCALGLRPLLAHSGRRQHRLRIRARSDHPARKRMLVPFQI